MQRVHGLTALCLVVGMLVGCEEPPQLDGPETLEKSRILMLRAEPPAIVPPGAVTLTVWTYDPDWRVPEIHWYAPLAVTGDVREAVPDRMRDPDLVPEGWLYLGAGTQATLPLPPIPDAAIPESLYFDTIPLAVVVSVSWGEKEVKGLYQLRVVLPSLVARNMAGRLGRAATTVEVADAVRRRLNRNPRLRELRLFAAVDAAGGYGNDARDDVKVRREEVQETRLLVPAVFAGALRLRPTIDDPDLVEFPDVIAGEPGFNPLSLQLIRPEGESYPISLTETDWAVKRHGAPPPLQPAFAVVFDGQGGVDARALEIDAGADPIPPHRGAFGSVLVGAGRRLAWLRLESTALRDAVRPLVGTTAVVNARAWSANAAPHGVTMAAAAVTAAVADVAATQAIFDAWTSDAAQRGSLHDAPVALTATVVRVWEP